MIEPEPARPIQRLRRLRRLPGLRDLVREHEPNVRDLVYPIFVHHGTNLKREIASMPGQFQYSLDRLDEPIAATVEAGIPAVLLFGIPEHKDSEGRTACDDQGIVQSAVRKIKRLTNDLVVITDVCFCEYTEHGHCGPLRSIGGSSEVDNDATLKLLAEQAASHARAGADVVAPSGMIDGMVAAIRRGLDDTKFDHIPILSYAAKFASAFYGPFRDAAGSAPAFGDRRGYQMDPAGGDEAEREVEIDISEGADMIMVKPALAYLDVVRRVKDRFRVPVAVYNVSGEYAMIKAAAKNGWIDEDRIVLETLTCFKRAGADIIITYHALDAARLLR